MAFIEGQVRLEKLCSFREVFSCPVFAQGYCRAANEFGKTKQITIKVPVDTTAGLNREDKEDIIRTQAREQVDSQQEIWGSCQN